MSDIIRTCWICFDDEEYESNSLIIPCDCPKFVHEKCMARWQLHSAGKSEENNCRFCDKTLSDWKEVIIPQSLKEVIKDVIPSMVVSLAGQSHLIPVSYGENGRIEFIESIKQIFELPDDADINIEFDCCDPTTGDPLKLDGLTGYDAAVYCAAISAANKTYYYDEDEDEEDK